MVVVLDAIESEKVEFDYAEDDIVELSQPFVSHNTHPSTSGKSPRPRWRLSRRGQWVLRTVSVFAIALVVFGNWLGVEEGKRGHHLTTSIVEASSSNGNGLGTLGVMLHPEHAEKLFLCVISLMI